tara:strand:+ start:437 stop:724 length:288 start_codon:yes stop_codon:yes gene_type:complete
MKKYWYFLFLLYKILVIVFMSLFCIGIIIYNVFINTNELTHIEKAIKKHNSIKESIANPKYPIISKPASSQSTVINQDSIRVYNKIELYKKDINE